MECLAVLGRQPKISLAELESLFSDVTLVQNSSEALARFKAVEKPDINHLGGSLKLARRLEEGPKEFLLNYLASGGSGKITFGISDYTAKGSAFSAQGEALKLKRILKGRGASVRVLPNSAAVLSSAAVLHNRLGRKPGCFEFVKCGVEWYLGVGVQNIDAYATRDFKRPARDAKVGMLPPKLAQILVNLCGKLPAGAQVLDPFCGTGVMLQEAILMGYRGYGTDASERMVGMAQKNLEWLAASKKQSFLETPRATPVVTGAAARSGARPLARLCSRNNCFLLATGDATNFTWQQPIDAVAFEGYLGPPMSAVPATIKMKSVISDLLPLYYHTLRNLSRQLRPGTPVVMAVPAWLRPDGHYQRLGLFGRTGVEFTSDNLDEIKELGYNVVKYKNLSAADLLYFRDGQVVAREIIVLRKR